MFEDTQILFFDAKNYDIEYFDRENQSYGFQIKYLREHLNPVTAEFTKGVDVVCVFVHDIINEKVIEALARNGVKLVALRCAGYNNVDLKAVQDMIRIVRVPGYSPYAVAEHTAALMLSLNRKIHKAYYRTRDGNFSINSFMGFDLFGKTAGVIGMGKIGKCLINILKGFGMSVLTHTRTPVKEYDKKLGIEYVTIDELLRQSDIISLQCPLTPETYHIINEESINHMKQGVMLLNTSRGALVNAVDLITGLKSGKIGSVGLDVYEEEDDYFFEDLSGEMISDDTLARLLTFPNVLITSHQGFFTREAMTNIAQTTLSNINDYLQGKRLENEVLVQ